MLSHCGGKIQAGETVILFFGHSDLRPLRITPGEELHCGKGKFRHNDIIGSHYGTRIKGISNHNPSSEVPTLLVLQNSANLWTLAVPHRTQIIYSTDIAVIITNMRLRPGSVVAEAGTGSASLSHSLARTIAPNGKVYTFDFHKGRAAAAREELRQNGLDGLVVSGWRDVCSPMTSPQPGDGVPFDTLDIEVPLPGFGLPAASVDAVFLDVPAPWLATENVLHVLKPNGVLCTFSPCIEQAQRTMERLRKEPHFFVDIRVVEALHKNYDPVFKRRRVETDRTSASEASESKPICEDTVQFRPAMVSKGHSAYLTFARRKIPTLSEDRSANEAAESETN